MRKQNNVSIDKKNRSSFEDFHMASVFFGAIRYSCVVGSISRCALDSV